MGYYRFPLKDHKRMQAVADVFLEEASLHMEFRKRCVPFYRLISFLNKNNRQKDEIKLQKLLRTYDIKGNFELFLNPVLTIVMRNSQF